MADIALSGMQKVLDIDNLKIPRDGNGTLRTINIGDGKKLELEL